MTRSSTLRDDRYQLEAGVLHLCGAGGFGVGGWMRVCVCMCVCACGVVNFKPPFGD